MLTTFDSVAQQSQECEIPTGIAHGRDAVGQIQVVNPVLHWSSSSVRVHVHQPWQQPHPGGIDHARLLWNVYLESRDAIAIYEHGGIRVLCARADVYHRSARDGDSHTFGKTSSTNRRYCSFWFQLVIRSVTSV